MICDRRIAERVKGKVYKMVVMYGLEMVTLTKRHEAKSEQPGWSRLDRISQRDNSG